MSQSSRARRSFRVPTSAFLPFAAAALFGASCGAGSLDKASVARGGALYDEFYVVKGAAAPSGDHPLWASRPDTTSNPRTGAATWRCKECHGWDYQGVDGSYGHGNRRTGFAGIFGTKKSAAEILDLLRSSKSHAYTRDMLSDEDLYDLTRFVLEGVVDVGDYIDVNTGKFKAEAATGQSLFTGGIGGLDGCGKCHGTTGTTPPPGADEEFEEYLGKESNENPVEILHKMRFGQPGTAMPQNVTKATPEELKALGAYLQGLPWAPNH